jgi:DNA-binding SARP family transcriptional activator
MGSRTRRTPALAIHLLGPFRVAVRGVPVADARWTRPQARLLLKILALAPSRRLHRHQLMELMWPGVDEDSGAAQLHKIIHLARRALEPRLKAGAESRFIVTSQQQVQLRAPGDLWIDAEAFEHAAIAAVAARTIKDHEQALALYGGDLLSEDPYADWISHKREQLRALRDQLLLSLGRLYAADRRHQQAAAHFEAVLAASPATEEAHRELMLLYATTGRRPEALRQFARCSEAVRSELDADVEDATAALYQRIVAREIRPLPADHLEQRPGDAIESLAVMPFTNETADPDLDFLATGIADTLIRNLSQVPGLRVLAYSTVHRYRQRHPDPRRLGRELEVSAIVTGRIARAASEVTVAPELADARDGSRIWGDHYRLPRTSILAVQEDISREIAEKLRLQMTADERRRIVKRYTADPEAYRLYLKGRFHWNKRTADGLSRGIEYFEQAIARDPSYALAYSGLADCYNLLSLYSVLPPAETMPRAREAARKALDIDEALAEAHTSLAYTYLYYDWDWSAAEREFRRALAINPNYATAHHWYHEFLTAMGRVDEQSAEILLAQELDPLSLIINTDVGWGLYYARAYDEAIEQLLRTLDLDANFAVAHVIAGLTYAQQGRLDEALSSVQRAIDVSGATPSTLALAALGYVCARSGRTADASQVMQRLDALPGARYAADYAGALVLAGLDDHGAACTRLERAVPARCDRLIYLNVEPIFDNLRGDPGFQRVVAGVGLPAPAGKFLGRSPVYPVAHRRPSRRSHDERFSGGAGGHAAPRRESVRPGHRH